MKARRWKNKKCAENHQAHLLILSAKLSEEAAEVSKEITKAPFRKKGLNKKALLCELRHVELIAGILRNEVESL